MDNQNTIYCDRKDHDKRTTLSLYVSNICERALKHGNCLIITTEKHLATWQTLLDQLTKLTTFIYDNKEMEGCAEDIQKCALFHYDVTLRGQITQRNQIMKYDVILATGSSICNSKTDLLKKLPFVQVIVDKAHLREQQESAAQILCKRVICNTSKPLKEGLHGLMQMISIVNPQSLLNSGAQKLSAKVETLQELEMIWKMASPVVRTHALDETQ